MFDKTIAGTAIIKGAIVFKFVSPPKQSYRQVASIGKNQSKCIELKIRGGGGLISISTQVISINYGDQEKEGRYTLTNINLRC